MSTSSIVNKLAGIRSKQPWLVMNAANKFSLSGSDNRAISHFYSFESKNTKEQTFAIPDGCVDILFDCDDSHPSAEVFGTPMEAITIELKKNHQYFGVRFIPGVMPDFLNVSASDLVGNHYNFLDLVSKEKHIVENIVSTSSFTEQVALFGKFFNGETIRKSSDLTSQILQSICKSHGTIRINELEDQTGYTSRTIQRKFLADMGMSPKAYCRIIRCQSAVYDLNNSEKIDFSDLACDLGFSDQSHFLRDFKKQVSTTPLDYLKRVKDENYLRSIRYL